MTDKLHSVLWQTDPLREPLSLQGHLRVLRSAVALWTGKDPGDIEAKECEQRLRDAWANDATGVEVIQRLGTTEREVLAIYRRHGGLVIGSVMRAELLARKLIRPGQRAVWSNARERSILGYLSTRFLLLPTIRPEYKDWLQPSYWSTECYPTLTLHEAVLRHIEPAGPPNWTLPPLDEHPEVLGTRTFAELTLDLTRMLSYLESKRQFKLSNGALPENLEEALKRRVPLKDPEFPLPHPYLLFLEIFRRNGIVRSEGDRAWVHVPTVGRAFSSSSAQQAHRWVRGWWSSSRWLDGVGRRWYSGLDDATAFRQLLCWHLSCLARQGPWWWDLETFVKEFRNGLDPRSREQSTWGGARWDPKWTLCGSQVSLNESPEKRWYFHAGRGLANALMVTLPALGMVERGRVRRNGRERWCFRLTELGRAVFGAPETEVPAEQTSTFLVVQPNFDTIIYLDRATPGDLARILRLTEGTEARGPVLTRKLTREGLARTLDLGLELNEVLDFLARSSQEPLPANVSHTLAEWGGRREGLVVRTRANLLAFPDSASRDEWARKSGGQLCGENFVLASTAPSKLGNDDTLWLDHTKTLRKTLRLSEDGTFIANLPLDLVQTARLEQFAERQGQKWRLTQGSLTQALQRGLKGPIIQHWLAQMLDRPVPELFRLALDNWLGARPKIRIVEVALLTLPSEAVTTAISESPIFKDAFLGEIRPTVLIVKKEKVDDLRRLFAEMGIAVLNEEFRLPR